MIIQCEQCSTKFKLDDSKVKPEGVKVKCKKCGNIFFVFPQTIEKEEKLVFDERIETKEKDESLNIGIFEANFTSNLEKEEEKISENKEETFSTIEWGNITEESFKESKKEDEKEEEKTFEDLIESIKEQEGEEELFKKDFEGISFPEQEKDDIQLTKEDDLEKTVSFEDFFEKEKQEELVIEDRTEQREFHIQDLAGVTQLDVSSELAPQISEELSENKDFIFIQDKSGVTEDDVKIQEEIKIPEDIDLEGLEKSTDKIEEAQQKPLPEDFLAEAPKKFNVLEFLIAILIVIVLGGGGVGYMWWQRVQMSEKIGHIGILNAKASFAENKELEKVFVVTGKIKNGYNVPKSFLKVKCVLLDKNNKKIGEKIVFAGNTFTEAEIKELTYAEIEKGLNNKMGKSMVNVDVPPGKVIDFMIVIDKLPEDVVAIEVEGV